MLVAKFLGGEHDFSKLFISVEIPLENATSTPLGKARDEFIFMKINEEVSSPM